MEKLTPAMKQYLDIKERYMDAIIFFRMGDFYEMFFEDAELASRLLGITLTSRDRGKENGIPMCGVPYHSAAGYVSRLVKEGHKVAICEQVEDPKTAKGIVKREVVRVVTPGIALDENLLDSKSNNFIAAISLGGNSVGMAYMDVTTGDFRLAEFHDIESLLEEINKIEPSELILHEGMKGKQELKSMPDCKITTIPVHEFDHDAASRRIMEHFNVASLEGMGCFAMYEGTRAAGAILFYVAETQFSSLRHVKRLIPLYPHNYMVVDIATKRNLEIMRSLRDGSKKGTLLALLDKTKTSAGGRKLKEWLNYPLMDIDEIGRRQDSIGEMLEDRTLRDEIQARLAKVYDLERLVCRVAMGVANPRDLVALKASLVEVPKIKDLLKDCGSILLRGIHLELDDLHEVVHLISSAIIDSPPPNVREGGVIKKGFNRELDELRSVSSGGKEWIAQLEAKERVRTGIGSLKIAYNKVFGYYIEVTKVNLAGIPADYVRKQTLTNAERFVTPELKEWEDRVLGAEEKALNLESLLLQGVIRTVAQYVDRIQKTAGLLAGLDVIASMAQTADERNYTRPMINDGDAIHIIDGRHPVIEASMDERFVPNDLLLDCDQNQLIILTGPNMAGKSTYMRQVALIVIMAQVGSFVSAGGATIGVVDRIFTRVGASDDLARGQSTFMVEMAETASILNCATGRSLVMLDEIGRGTSTFDGMSIAWAVAEHLHDNERLRSKTLFATHYHELTELSMTKERVKNFSMAIKEWNGRIIFLRKIVPGGSNRSYGIHVARLAGLPEGVVARAKEILDNLEKGELDAMGMPRIAAAGAGEGVAQMSLFRRKDPLRDEVLELNPNEITPLEALQVIFRLKEIAEQEV